MKRRSIVLVAVCFSVMAVGVATAWADAEAPDVGRVYATREDRSIKYNCKKKNQNRIECEFIETGVSMAKSKSDWEKTKKDIQTKDIEEAKKSMCSKKGLKQWQSVIDATDGKKVQVDEKMRQHIGKMPKPHRRDMRRIFQTFVDFCKKPTPENALRMKKAIHDKEARTCKIYSSRSVETFRRGVDKTWIADDKASGICGIVRLDRFEFDKSTKHFWNFFSRKAVTNPNADFFGKSCSKMIGDESTYPYLWASRQIYKKCDYIEFGF